MIMGVSSMVKNEWMMNEYKLCKYKNEWPV